MDSLAEQIIIQILTAEMKLAAEGANANIWIRNQTHLIPETDGLFVVVGLVDARYMSAQSNMEQQEIDGPDDTQVPQQVEITTVQMRENIQIDLFSRNNDALFRHWEVLAALVSIRSQQAQEQNSFKIFPQHQSFLNTSFAEGAANLNRFSIIIPTFVWYRKERVLTETGGNYYDDYATRVDDAKTIGQPDGLFEFRITPEGIDP